MVSTIQTVDTPEVAGYTSADLYDLGAQHPDQIQAFVYGFMTAVNPAYGGYNPALLPPHTPETVAIAIEKEWPWYKRGWAAGVLLPWLIGLIVGVVAARYL